MKVVNSIQFLDDGSVVLQFMDLSSDVRNKELLVMSHQLLVRPGDGGRDYEDEIEDVRDAARRLLDDVMQDWLSTTDVGVQIEEPDDDDDEPFPMKGSSR